MYTCSYCDSPIPKRFKVTPDDIAGTTGHNNNKSEELFFCDGKCRKEYHATQTRTIMESFIERADVIREYLLPLMDAKSLHNFKCTKSQLYPLIEEFIRNEAPKLQFQSQFGTRGNDISQFQKPFFVISDKKGNICVSESGNNKIQILDRNGQWKQEIGPVVIGFGQLSFPMGIAFNSQNHLILADGPYGIMQVFKGRKRINDFATKGNGEEESDDNSHSSSKISGVAVDREDNILVVQSGDRPCIKVFDKAGKFKQMIKKQKSVSPWGIAVSKTDGRIFVSDYGNHCIHVYGPNGSFLFQFGSRGIQVGQFRYPYGITLSNCERYLLVCDAYNHRIQVFNAMNGAFIKSYGSKGSGNGQFLFPTGICTLPSGEIVVSEGDIFGGSQHRIQILK